MDQAGSMMTRRCTLKMWVIGYHPRLDAVGAPVRLQREWSSHSTAEIGLALGAVEIDLHDALHSFPVRAGFSLEGTNRIARALGRDITVIGAVLGGRRPPRLACEEARLDER